MDNYDRDKFVMTICEYNEFVIGIRSGCNENRVSVCNGRL